MNDTGSEIRRAAQQDLDWILRLNKVHEHLLSPLDAPDLAVLIQSAWMTLVRPAAAGFVVCFDHEGAYDSPNFLWFRERYPRFVYVDRIAVDAEAGLRGTGSALYASVFEQAAAQGYPMVCAEVYSEPPNQGSLDFHARKGFEAVGEQHFPEKSKSVRYFVRRLG